MNQMSEINFRDDGSGQDSEYDGFSNIRVPNGLDLNQISGLGDIKDMIEGSSIILVRCSGCNNPRPINAAYGKYVSQIKECRFCRGSQR